MHFRDIYITKLAFYGETFLVKFIPYYQVLISGRLESESEDGLDFVYLLVLTKVLIWG